MKRATKQSCKSEIASHLKNTSARNDEKLLLWFAPPDDLNLLRRDVHVPFFAHPPVGKMFGIDHDINQGKTAHVFDAPPEVLLKGRDLVLFFDEHKMRLAEFLKKFFDLGQGHIAAFRPEEHGPVVTRGA